MWNLSLQKDVSLGSGGGSAGIPHHLWLLVCHALGQGDHQYWKNVGLE